MAIISGNDLRQRNRTIEAEKVVLNEQSQFLKKPILNLKAAFKSECFRRLVHKFSTTFFCRYWEAIKRWDGALGINPMNERLHEMKSQVSK